MREEPLITLTWGTTTHPGHRRSRNEDAAVAGPSLFAVADGMGGHAAGDVAARIVVDHLQGLIAADHLDRGTVLERIRSADAEVVTTATGSDAGMGTTVSGLALVAGARPGFVVFNVGDSRVYRLRGGTLTQLTHDHSVVQELIDAGSITYQQSLTHPERNVITRSLGAGEPLDIDWWRLQPQDRDRYLVTSDGLTKELAPETIAVELARAGSPQERADALVAAALGAGGRDNVTVVVVDVALDHGVPETPVTDPLDVDTTPRHRVGVPGGDADAFLDLDADTTPVGFLAVVAPAPTDVAHLDERGTRS